MRMLYYLIAVASKSEKKCFILVVPSKMKSEERWPRKWVLMNDTKRSKPCIVLEYNFLLAVAIHFFLPIINFVNEI